MKTLAIILLLFFPAAIFAVEHDTVLVGPGQFHLDLVDALADSAQDLSAATGSNKVLVFKILGDQSGSIQDGGVSLNSTDYPNTNDSNYVSIIASGVARHSGAPFAAQSFYRIKNTTNESRDTPNFFLSCPWSRLEGFSVEQGKTSTAAGDILFRVVGAHHSTLRNMIIIDSLNNGGTTTGLQLSGNLDGFAFIGGMIHGMNTGGSDTAAAIRLVGAGGDPGTIRFYNLFFNDNDVDLKLDTITFGGSWDDSLDIRWVNNASKSTDDFCITLESGSIAGGNIHHNSFNNQGPDILFITPGTFGDTANITATEYAVRDSKARDFHGIDENVTGSLKGLGFDLTTAGFYAVTRDVDGDLITGNNVERGFDEFKILTRVKVRK